MFLRTKVDTAISPIPRSTPSRALPPVASRTIFTSPISDLSLQLVEPTVVPGTDTRLDLILQEWLPSIPAPLAIGGTLCLVGGAFLLQARSKNNTIASLRNELTTTFTQLVTKKIELTESNVDRAHLLGVIAKLNLIVETYVSNGKDLRSSISTLTATVSGLNISIVQLKAKNTSLQGRNDYLKKAFLSCIIVLMKTNERLESSQRQHNSSEVKVADLEEQLENSITKKDAVTSERDGLVRDLKTAKASSGVRIADLEQHLETSVAEKDDVTSERDGLVRDLDAVKDSSKVKIAGLKKQLEIAIADKDEITLKSNKLQEDLSAAKKDIVTLKATASISSQDYKRETDALKKQMHNKHQDLESAQEEVVALKQAATTSSEAYMREIDDLKKQIRKKDEDLESAHEDVVIMKNNVEDSMEILESKKRDIDSLKKQIYNKDKDLKSAHGEISAMKEDVASSTKALESSKREADSLRKVLSKRDNALESARGEISAMKEDVGSSTKTLESSKRETDSLKKEITFKDKELESVNDEISASKDARNDLEAKAKALTAEKGELAAKNQDLTNEVAFLNGRVDVLATASHKFKVECDALSVQLANLNETGSGNGSSQPCEGPSAMKPPNTNSPKTPVKSTDSQAYKTSSDVHDVSTDVPVGPDSSKAKGNLTLAKSTNDCANKNSNAHDESTDVPVGTDSCKAKGNSETPARSTNGCADKNSNAPDESTDVPVGTDSSKSKGSSETPAKSTDSHADKTSSDAHSESTDVPDGPDSPRAKGHSEDTASIVNPPRSQNDPKARPANANGAHENKASNENHNEDQGDDEDSADEDKEMEPAIKGHRRQKKTLKNARARAATLQNCAEKLTTSDIKFEDLQYEHLAELCKGFTTDQTESVVHTAIQIAQKAAAPGVSVLRIGQETMAEAIREIADQQLAPESSADTNANAGGSAQSKWGPKAHVGTSGGLSDSRWGNPGAENGGGFSDSSRDSEPQFGSAGALGGFGQNPNRLPQPSYGYGLNGPLSFRRPSGPASFNRPRGPSSFNRPSGPPSFNHPSGPASFNRHIGPPSFNNAAPPNAPTGPAAQGYTAPPPMKFESRIELLQRYKHSSINRADNIDWRRLAYQTSQFHGGQINEVIDHAFSRARKEERTAINQKDIEDGISHVHRMIIDARA